MASQPKYHLRTQRADALLRPIVMTVRELEQRTQHYLDRLEVEPDEDLRVLRAAHDTLGTARAALERLCQDRAARALPTSTGEERE